MKTLKTCYEAPALVSVTATSDTTIDVEWETACGKNSTIEAQKYTVQYSTDGAKWTNATTAATGNSYTIQKLKGGVEYQVRVLASKDNAFEASVPSEVKFAETLATPTTTLDKAFVTDDSFKVTVTNYQTTNLADATAVNVTSDLFDTVTINLANGSGSATFDNGMVATFENGVLTFTNAPSNTQQKIQVSFTKDACTTALSNALTVKTTKTCYETPANVTATATSDTTIDVTWATAKGKNSTIEAQKYTVQYSTNGSTWTNATTGATGNSFTIKSLKGGNVYQVRVLANTDSNFNASAPNDPAVIAKTLATPKVALDKASLTHNSFNATVTNYLDTNLKDASQIEVTYGSVDDVVIIVINDGVGSGTFDNGMAVAFDNGVLTFTNALSYTQQKIQVRFTEGVCTTAWSNALSFTTAKEA